MSKTRIYIKPEEISDFIEIRNKDIVHKIRNVLVLKKDQKVCIFNGRGKEYIYRIENIEKKRILIKKEIMLRESSYPNQKLILSFPFVREDKINFILQKATELGAAGFIPFVCQRSIKVKPSLNRLERWGKIIIEASRQSQRLWLPFLGNVVDFDGIAGSNYKIKLAASIEGKRIESILGGKQQEILLVVGPEGDFSLSEYDQLRKNNFKFVRLSSGVLRIETAAIFAVGLINYLNRGRTQL